MSEADEIFEKLGYEDSPCGYGAKRYKGRNYFITFYKHQIRIVPREIDDDIILDFKEIGAINLKCKELGWVEE